MIELQEELVFLEKYIEFSGEEYDAFKLVDNDPPDLVLFKQGKKISVEVTRLLKRGGQKILQHTKFINKFKAMGIAQSVQESSFPLFVEWEFKFPLKIRQSRTKVLVQEIVDLTTNTLYDNLEFRLHTFPSEKLPKELKMLSVSTWPNLTKTYWKHDKLWLSGELKEHELFSPINTKNEKAILNGYAEEYDENWLLLVVESKPHSSFADYNQYKWKRKQEWVFDRIVVIDLWDNKAIEIFD